MKNKRILLKLSGESLKKDSVSIFDSDFLKSVAQQIKRLVDRGYEIGIVIGGGNIWRGRISKELNMERESADWMGMLATVINSLSLKALLENMNQSVIIMNSFNIDNCGEILNPKKANIELEKGSVIVFGGGTGRTNLSTDTAAAMRARDINATLMLMGKNNADGIFDSDPNENSNAVFFENITYKEIIEKKLNAIDFEALKILDEFKIKTIVFDLNKKNSILNSIDNKSKQTIITK